MEDDLGRGRGECVSGSRASQGKGTEYHGGSRGACGGGEVLTRHAKAPNTLRPVQVARVQETLISEIPLEWVDCEGDKAAGSREMSQRTEAQSR